MIAIPNAAGLVAPYPQFRNSKFPSSATRPGFFVVVFALIFVDKDGSGNPRIQEMGV
jgi:hypothetical protein